MKRFVAVLGAVLALPAFAEVMPVFYEEEIVEVVDYAGQAKLDFDAKTQTVEVTVKSFIDGDTTHFNIPDDFFVGHTLKARYLAVNTPESTGKIEEYGKAASRFTREKLEQAVSIILESDSDVWNVDSTGGRYLVWVWYKTAES